MDFNNLLSTYFPQLLVVIGGITYFIKRYFDLQSKKIEIKHSLFHQNKIEAIKSYFLSYIKCERAFQSISTGKLIKKEYTPKELDEITKTSIDDLLANDLNMNLFIDNNNLEKFNSVTKQLLSVHDMYQDAYLWADRDFEVIPQTNKLYRDFENIRKNNREVLKEIGKNVKEAFANKG